MGVVECCQLPTSLLQRRCSGSNVTPDMGTIFLLVIDRNMEYLSQYAKDIFTSCEFTYCVKLFWYKVTTIAKDY